MNDENVMSECNSLKPKNIEIERKYLIKMPDLGTLRMQPGYSSSSIEQMYIFDSGNSSRDRIRKRVFEDHVEYWKTHKENINGISKIEIENEITEEEYATLSECKIDNSRIIRKVRHCFVYKNQLLELDIYEFWTDCATVEAELESEDQEVELPGFIEVIKDVTTDESYSNFALAMSK